MNKFAETSKHEFAEIIPPTLYFFVILHVVAFIRVLMTEGNGIAITTSASVAVAALILGKAVLIANALPFINRFPEKPLIWNVCWKTLLYCVVALLIHYLEHLYEYWKTAPGFAAANHELLAHIVWPHFWAIQILLALLILAYTLVSELARVMGRSEVKTMFFGPLPSMR